MIHYKERPGFSPWGALSAELVHLNLQIWRQMAEIQFAALLAIAAPPETPTGRRRKFRVIHGGRR
jgi:hypothetical protein